MDGDSNFKKVFLIALIISLSISALFGAVIFLLGKFDSIQVRILLTTLTVGGFSLTGLCCSALLDKKRFPLFAAFGIISSFLGFVLIVSLIWEFIHIDNFSGMSQFILITIIVAISTAHACLLLLISSDKTAVNVSLAVTLLFISLVAIELIVLVFARFNHVDEMWWRLLGVFGIFDVLGTIVTPIIMKVSSLHDKENTVQAD